ncbi:MAG: STAS domain-containing protein [Spirochaetia bacterium]|nr:STAS domain-containing protein [Spirochaetia bacterium]
MSVNPLLRLKVEIENIDGKKVIILFFSGKINSDNVFDINQRIKKVFEEGIYNCIIHLSELEYLNSTGIAMFLTIARTIEQNGGKLILTKPSDFVKDLFDLTDLESRFKFVNSMEEAKKLIK